ncbi:MAG: DUF2065 domain-containing protein [Desulfobacterales bacterium]
MKFFLSIIGMVMIIEGLPYFAFPERMKDWILRITALPVETLRRMGFFLMLTGMVLLYASR